MIDGVRKALVLAPHTDDGEFGCAGTICRLVEAGAEVHYMAFSTASRSLPEGFPEDTLLHEVRAATAELGISREHLTVHDFEVRTFPTVRQEILEILVATAAALDPDMVLMPSLVDIHQDHETIAREGLRAFKRTTLLGYEIPWNCVGFRQQAYVVAGAPPPRPQGRGAGLLRQPAAPQLRERGVHPQPRAHQRHRQRA